MTTLRLSTTLEPFGPAGAIILTDEQVASLTTAKAFPVVVTVDGETAQLRLTRMGGQNCIGFSKATRAQLGVELGDRFDAEIAVDTVERTVEIPSQLAAALASRPAAKAAFDALSYTRRKEIARSVADAKQDATRERRLAKALDELES